MTINLELVHSQSQPRAKVRGEPLHELPADLYIPPDALEVFLDTFQGPLDLLLYLIRKANIDILDIPMARLTAQYLEYVEAMRAKNLELAAEYLVMAAMLMEIKSRLLLPRPQGGRGRRDRPARRAGAAPARIRADEGGRAASSTACRSVDRDFLAVEVWIEQTAGRAPAATSTPQDIEDAWRSLLAPRAAVSATTKSRATSCRCAST